VLILLGIEYKGSTKKLIYKWQNIGISIFKALLVHALYRLHLFLCSQFNLFYFYQFRKMKNLSDQILLFPNENKCLECLNINPYEIICVFLGTNCGALLVGPTGKISSVNFPNSYGNNQYCRWRITVRSDRKVMLTFNSFKTQAEKDFVEIYDGVSGELISKLSGIHTKPFSLTSSSNVVDVRFYSDQQDVAMGFEATYLPVCK
jgi:hypothetical protein